MNYFNIINNLSLKHKLTLLVGFPFLGLCLFAYITISNSIQFKNDADKFSKLVTLSTYSSALVHELQKERGMSAGFIGSKGTKFANKLINQRQLVNQKADELNQFLKDFETSQYDNQIGNNINKITSYLADLNNKRNAVSGFNISVAAAVRYYSELNSSLIATSELLAKFAPKGTLSNIATAYFTFLQSKERAGIERAVMSNVFAQDTFTKASLGKFTNLVNTQEIYLKVFAAVAPKNHSQFFQDKISDRSVTEVERMRNLAFQKAETGNFGIDAEYWFEIISQKIGVLKEIEDFINADLQEVSTAYSNKYSANLTNAVLKALAILVISTLLGWYISKKIAAPVTAAAQVANNIAAGHLDNLIVVSSKDETGQLMQALQKMQQKLLNVIQSTQGTANIVKNTAQEIAQGNSNLSERTEQQASSLEETAASMEEMTSTVKQNADNAKQANQLARAARELAEKGGSVVGNAVSAMNDINESSKKIADIISVIDEIAFQTNLLALNAAVEAARAGEQGRGFAVVASEVRSLAGRSATAAKEIKDLIQDSVGKIEGGAELVNQSGQTLDEIVNSVKKVSDIIAEIAAASQEQSSGIDQVGRAVMQMDDLTQQNAALVEEAAAASEAMGNKAVSLTEILAFFTIGTQKNIASANDEGSAEVIPLAATGTSGQSFNAVSTNNNNKKASASSSAMNTNSSEWEEF